MNFTFEKKYFLFLQILIFGLTALILGYLNDETILYGSDLWDDSLIIHPLQRITTLSDYYHALQKDYIKDFQPLRDLSYLIDFQLMQIIPIYNHRIGNLIIFFLTLSCFGYILHFFSISNVSIIAWLTLIIAHPHMNVVWGWQSSRKHILATLFLLIAICYLLKKSYKCVLFFAASLLSSPLYLLSPFLAYPLMKNLQIKFNKYHLYLAILLATIIGVINLLTYQHNIYGWNSYALFPYTCLTSLYNIFIPLTPSFLYPFLDIRTYLAGSVLIFFLIYSFYYKKMKNLKNHFLIFMLPILPTFNYFVSDYYLLLPICYFWWKLTDLMMDKKRWIYLIVLAMFMLTQLGISNMWKNNYQLSLQASENSPAPHNLFLYLQELYKKNDHTTALDVAKNGLERLRDENEAQFYQKAYFKKMESFFTYTLIQANLSAHERERHIKSIYYESFIRWFMEMKNSNINGYFHKNLKKLDAPFITLKKLQEWCHTIKKINLELGRNEPIIIDEFLMIKSEIL